MNKHTLIYVGMMIVAGACEIPPDNLLLLDEFVVSTNYDTEADFESYETYAIPTDTIGYISNTPGSDTILVQDDVDFPRPVLNALRSNMNARGYTQVDVDANPDLGINVVLVNDFNVFQEVIYPSGYYSGYYGYGSSYYYPYVNTYAYNTGVLIVEIVDLKNRTPDNKVKVIWNSYMGDVYSSFDAIEQAKEAIDRSFIQSPYLEND